MAQKIYLYDNDYDCIGTGCLAAEYIQYQLNQAAGEDVEVHISSVGGDAFQAVAIYDILKRYNGKVTTFIDSVAASAAATIAMSGKTVVMSKYALLMIHKPSTFVQGDANDLQADVQMLDAIQRNIVKIYMDKTGMDEDAINVLVNATTWLTADEALQMGFIDSVEDYVETQPIIKNAALVSNYMNAAPTKYKQVINKLLIKEPAPATTQNTMTEQEIKEVTEPGISLIKKVLNLFKAASLKKVVTNKGEMFIAGNISNGVSVFNDGDMDVEAEDAIDVSITNEAGVHTFNIVGGKASNVVTVANKKDEQDMDDDEDLDADNKATLNELGINMKKKEVDNKALKNKMASKLREVTNKAAENEQLLIQVTNQLKAVNDAISKNKQDIKDEILSEFVPTGSQRSNKQTTNSALPSWMPEEGSIGANAVKKSVTNKGK